MPVAVAVGVLLVAAVAWLYPPQVRELRGFWRWGLPGLRVMALGALAVSVAKPSVLRPKTVDERPAVVVLVDRSRSMAVVDNARTPGQLVALADGLGRLPPGARRGEGAALAAEVARVTALADAAARARGDWEYARVSGRGVEAARRRAEDAAAAVTAAAAALAGKASRVSDEELRQRLAALGASPEAPTAAGGDDAALRARLADLRSKLADAQAAAERAQGAADELLYRSNEDVRRACDALAGRSRFQLVEEALLRPEAGLVRAVGRQAGLVGYAVADGLSPIRLNAGAEAGAAKAAEMDAHGNEGVGGNEGARRNAGINGSAGAVGRAGAGGSTGGGAGAEATLGAEPDGRVSDIAGAVREALGLAAGRDVAAVVVLTDGRQTGGGGAVTAGLSAAGVPVFPVAVAPPGAVKDVSFGNVSLPASAFVGETITVRAELRPVGVKEFATELRAKAGDVEVAKPVAGREGKAGAAEFAVKLERAGTQQVTLVSKAVDGEATAENNEVKRWVKVLSQKVRVGAYAGSPGWDFQYVRNALSRTGWVDLDARVLRPAEGARLPLSPAQLLELDVLLLFDVSPASLEMSQWDAIYRQIAERGGSVILVAGESHLPGEYGQQLVTANLLPYPPEQPPTWRMWPGERPLFRFAPHPEAEGKGFLRLDLEAGDDARAGGTMASGRRLERWQALPGLYRFLPIGRLKPTASPLLIEVASGAPVLTEMRVGAGRSFLLGANETWRWRFKSGERDHDRFWLQLVRYAAGEPYAVRTERLALDLDKVALEQGESVRVRVRMLQPALGANTGGRLHTEVTRDDRVVQSVPLFAAAVPASGQLETRVGPLPEGDYEVRVVEGPLANGDAAADRSQQSPSLPLHVGRSYETELADVSGDYSVLRRLAEASGGEFFTLDQVNRLPDRLRVVADRRPRYIEQRLWDSPYLFVFVVACLATEWAARKRLGLA